MGKNKELAKNTVIISIGKLCTQFLSFMLLPLYTSILSTAEYGTVDLLITYQQLIGFVIFCQIEQALFRFMIDARGQKEKMSSIISSCMVFALIQAAVLGVVLGIFGLITKYAYTGYLYLYVLAVISSSLMLQVARGAGKNAVYALASFVSAISIIVFNILFLVVFKLGIAGMLTAYILGGFLSGLLVFIVLKVYKYIHIKNVSVSQIKECLKYSLPLVPNALSWWVMSASDRSIVAFTLGASYNGILTVAHKFPSAYSAFYTVFNLSWTESASLHIKDADSEVFFTKVTQTMYRFFSCLAIGVIAVMPFIFPLMINKSYGGAYNLIPLYMLASVFNVVQGLYSVIYVGLKKTKEIAKTTIVSAVINIVVNLLLIKFIGLYAAAISSVVAYGTIAVWRYFDLKKYMTVKMDKKAVVSSIIIGVLVGACYYSKNLLLAVAGLAVAAVYSVILNWDIIKVLLKSPKMIKDYIFKSKN